MTCQKLKQSSVIFVKKKIAVRYAVLKVLISISEGKIIAALLIGYYETKTYIFMASDSFRPNSTWLDTTRHDFSCRVVSRRNVTCRACSNMEDEAMV